MKDIYIALEHELDFNLEIKCMELGGYCRINK